MIGTGGQGTDPSSGMAGNLSQARESAPEYWGTGAPEGLERPERPERPEGPERPERPDHASVPGLRRSRR
ncbi:hypothetical protein SCMC78_13000 [Streptomyces sp. CMC78]|uniref:Uncharacterized protein n=1 Tax=Streptomyces sp. CMC78 TaxID=3231512 RepID=A0AB33K8I5_9ACTN